MSDSEDSNQGKVVVRDDSDSDDSSSGSDSSSSDEDGPSNPPSAPSPAPGAPHAPADGSADPNTVTTVAVVNEDDLPNLEPALSNMQPIPLKKTLMIVNNFIINTTEFMNKFTVLCEGKLSAVSQKTTNLEIMMALLEVKLGSIDWLGGGSSATAPAASGDPAAASAAGAPPPPPSAPGAPPPPPPGPPGAPSAPTPPAPGVPAADPAAAAPAFEGPCLKDDPRFAKFFKMRDMGIPVQALAIKMNAEGVDPAILDMDPLGPPPGGSAPAPASTQMVVIEDDSDASSEESELDAD